MKKVECVIRPERLDELKTALIQAGAAGMTITDVKGFGKQNTRPDNYLVLPKTKVEIYCSEENRENIIETIVKVCRKNELGDGKIIVSHIEEVVRIRTGERSLHGIY